MNLMISNRSTINTYYSKRFVILTTPTFRVADFLTSFRRLYVLWSLNQLEQLSYASTWDELRQEAFK